jgi:UDP-glucose 4-epimerase
LTGSSSCVLVSGGAGYIGSHVAHVLAQSGFHPVVLDNLINGHRWAVKGDFCQGDVADSRLVREIIAKYRPVAALHFAAFIEVGESVQNPEKYFINNRDKAKVFFDTLSAEGVRHIVFSSTAAVYGEPQGTEQITEDFSTNPINPYGQSKLEAETYLRKLPSVTSATLRYFNVAGAAPEVGLGEAHMPESHLIPRIVLPLIGTPTRVRQKLGLKSGFKIYGEDYPTRDGTAVRDYLHVLDLAKAHVLALRYLMSGGANIIFNLGTGAGSSVREIVQAARVALKKPHYMPGVAPRRPGDPPMLVASGEKAKLILGWQPERGIHEMIASAAAWHRGSHYIDSIMGRAG